MQKNSVFHDAKWIWHQVPCIDLVNSWMQCRKVIEISRVPEELVISITADSRYRLFVNGCKITTGPARGFQKSWPYDEMDIVPYLQRGKNAVCVLVHNYGTSNCQYVHQGWAGMILAGQLDGLDFSTGPDWKVRTAPGCSRHTARLSLELGYQEFFDATKDDHSWLGVNYDDSGWKSPHCQNFGAMPWYDVEPRKIPFPNPDERFTASGILFESTRNALEGYKETENVVDVYLGEKHTWKKNDDSPQDENGFSGLHIDAKDQDIVYALTVDFGREVVGWPEFEIEGSGGGEILDILYCEKIDENGPIFSPTNLESHVAMGSRIILRKGLTTYEFFSPIGFRYMVLILRNAKSKLHIKTRINSALYPLEIKGGFACSDERLNEIYNMSVWTQRCCMLDAHVDCPWREQVQWWGDARIQALNTFILSADTRLFERGIRQLGTQKVPNGLTYGHAPTHAHHCILPDFSLVWLLTIWDQYQLTGSLSLFEELQEEITGVLGYFENFLSDNGLLCYDDRYWLFLDWGNIFREGYPTVYNMLYLAALRAVCELCELSGNAQLTMKYQGQAKKLEENIVKKLYSNENDFLAGLTFEGEPVTRNEPHVYTFAVLLDLIPLKNKYFTETYLLDYIQYGDKLEYRPSPYFTFYLFQAALKMSYRKEVVDSIRKYWGRMLDKGLSTTEEMWETRAGFESFCHAWSAHPIVFLSEILLGIRQKNVNWTQIEFQPLLSGPDEVEGKVATVHGVIEVSICTDGRHRDIRIHIPKGICCNVILPGRESQWIEYGEHNWKL